MPNHLTVKHLLQLYDPTFGVTDPGQQIEQLHSTQVLEAEMILHPGVAAAGCGAAAGDTRGGYSGTRAEKRHVVARGYAAGVELEL